MEFASIIPRSAPSLCLRAEAFFGVPFAPPSDGLPRFALIGCAPPVRTPVWSFRAAWACGAIAISYAYSALVEEALISLRCALPEFAWAQ